MLVRLEIGTTTAELLFVGGGTITSAVCEGTNDLGVGGLGVGGLGVGGLGVGGSLIF